MKQYFHINIIIFIIIAIFIFFISHTALANNIYVSVNGNDVIGDGSEFKPFASIQYALNQAEDGYTINVGVGIFYENIVWPATNGIMLIGAGENSTIIDGMQKESVISFPYNLNGIIDEQTVIKSLMITNGFSINRNCSSCYSDCSGGGILINNCEIVLSNINISENTSSHCGGGIYCENSTLYLSNVTITENISKFGGGIYSRNSTINFDKKYRSNIYFNNSYKTRGADIWSDTKINLFLDSFTVNNPNGYYVYALDILSFDIKQSKIPPKKYNLFVSPDGDNSNSGDSFKTPLKNIYYALSVIQADENNPLTIYLDSGTYNQESNNEKYPLIMSSHISIVGKNEDETILDGNSESRIIEMHNSKNTQLKSLKIKNGYLEYSEGSGIKCYDSSASLSYLKIENNIAAGYGGGIYSELCELELSNILIANNQSYLSGSGIYCSQSEMLLSNVNIFNNSPKSGGLGGGLYVTHKSKLYFSDGTIKGNTSSFDGGGIYLSSSSATFTNTVISENMSGNHGGGIYCQYKSTLNLADVTISKNTAEDFGGGICCVDSKINFDSKYRSNIYYNNAISGKDLYTNNEINLILESFTVKNPTSYFVTPKNFFSFDIIQGQIPQKNFDLYVSPFGDNANNGKTQDTPLKNIGYALSVIQVDEDNSHTIYLNKGIYSKNSNDENFPLSMVDYVNIEGLNHLNADEVILDGNNKDMLLYFNRNKSIIIKNLQIISGKSNTIYCRSSNPLISNIILSQNIDSSVYVNGDGAIYCSLDSFPTIINCIIINNTFNRRGGGITLYANSNKINIINSIVWNNTPIELISYSSSQGNSNEITIVNSIIKNGQSGILVSEEDVLYWKEGNLSSNPLFKSTENNYYHLQSTSPCIDAGKADTDGDGLTWKVDPDDRDPDGSRKDIGAIFYRHPLKLTIPDKVLETDGLLKNYGHISIPFITYDDIIINVYSSSTNDIIVPQTVVIPAEFSSTTFDLNILDTIPVNTKAITITAVSPYFISACNPIIIVDSYIRSSDLKTSHNIKNWDGKQNLQIEITNSQAIQKVKGFSYVFDDNPLTIPDNAIDITDTVIRYTAKTSDNLWFHIHAIDQDGNIGSTLHLGPYYIDVHLPDIDDFHINNNDPQCTNKNVTLNLLASDEHSGIFQINISNTDFGAGEWVTYQKLIPWVLIGDNGLKTVYVQVQDNAGNISQIQDSIEIQCIFDISPQNIQLDLWQKSAKIYIKNLADCSWYARTDNDWIDIISQNNGIGSGFIEICAEDSVNSQKNGFINIADQTISVSYDTTLPDVSGVQVFLNDNHNIQIAWEPFLDFNIGYHIFRSQLKDGIYYPVNSFPVDFFTAKNGFIDYATVKDNTYCYAIKAEDFQGIVSNLSEPACCKVADNTDYDISFESYPQSIINIGGTVDYLMYIKLKESFKGWIDVSCSGIPSSMHYNFILNNEEKGSSVHQIEKLPAILDLEIIIGSATPVGKYSFDISFQNHWLNGSSPRRVYPLTVNVVNNNKGGIYVDIQEKEIFQGETNFLFGQIYPPINSRQINISLTSETNDVQFFNVITQNMGKYENSSFIKSLTTGKYTIVAQWQDDNSNNYSSEELYLNVKKHKSSLSLFHSIESQPQVDEDYTISGFLNPSESGQQVSLKVMSPDNNVQEYRLYTDLNGKFQYTQPFFMQKGIYKIKSYWQGNKTNIGCESNMLIISVGSPGYAFLLGGGKFDQYNLYAQATRKLITKMYQDLKHIGYNDDSIFLSINTDIIDIDNDGNNDSNLIDETFPSLERVLDILDNQFLQSLNSETPLFLYLQGHGRRDGKFELIGYDDYLSSEILAEKLDKLQSKTDCLIVILLEFCYSGTFIEDLSKENRIILTSVDADHAYPTDNYANLSFSRYVLSRIIRGDSIQKAFNWANYQQLKLNYPLPKMDDNGDKLADQNDGLFASNIYMGNNLLWNRPVITDVFAPIVLNQNETTAKISISLNESKAFIKKVYAQIISPKDKIIMNKDIVVTFDQQEFEFNDTNQRFEATITNLIQPGIYNIIIYAENIDNEKSDPEFIYIRTAHSKIEHDLNSDYLIDINDVIFGLKILCQSYIETDIVSISLSDVIKCMIAVSTKDYD